MYLVLQYPSLHRVPHFHWGTLCHENIIWKISENVEYTINISFNILQNGLLLQKYFIKYHIMQIYIKGNSEHTWSIYLQNIIYNFKTNLRKRFYMGVCVKEQQSFAKPYDAEQHYKMVKNTHFQSNYIH